MQVEKRGSAPVALDSIRVNVSMPVTRLGFGPLSFDPVEKMIGMPIKDILEPLMAGEVFRRPSMTGPSVDVFPLALPPGEGATIRLGHLGDVGFKNDRGLLMLTVPLLASTWVKQRLGTAILQGPVEALSTDGTARVAEFWVRLTPGMRTALPLGILGEVGIEAG